MGLKKRIAMGLTTIGLVSALVGGATFAIFTSSATNSGNTFTAGTVVIDAGEGVTQTTTTPLNVANLAPGDTYTGTFTVTSTGTLEAKIQSITPSFTGELANDCTVTVDQSVIGQTIPSTGLAVPFTVAYSINATVQEESGSLTFDVVGAQVRNN